MYCGAKCRLIAVYRSTDRAQQSEDFTKQLTQCLDSLFQVTWPCYISGNFKARNLDWSGMTAIHNQADKILLDYSVNNGFTQLVNKTTRNDNVLDILLANEPNIVYDVQVGTPFGGSDHCCVNCTVVLESALLFEPPNNTVTDSSQGTKRYRWKDTNYAALADYLATCDWNHLFS